MEIHLNGVLGPCAQGLANQLSNEDALRAATCHHPTEDILAEAGSNVAYLKVIVAFASEEATARHLVLICFIDGDYAVVVTRYGRLTCTACPQQKACRHIVRLGEGTQELLRKGLTSEDFDKRVREYLDAHTGARRLTCVSKVHCAKMECCWGHSLVPAHCSVSLGFHIW